MFDGSTGNEGYFYPMRYGLFCLFVLFAPVCLQAFSCTGVYTYSKGMNKAAGALYVCQFSADSGFIMLQAVSGMPDFHTTELRGFIRIQQQEARYVGKDSCEMTLRFADASCLVTEYSSCRHAFSANGKYKKSNKLLRKESTFLPMLADKKGTVIHDSTVAYLAPHRSAPVCMLLPIDAEVDVLDDYNGYYLVALDLKSREFIWVPRKKIRINP